MNTVWNTVWAEYGEKRKYPIVLTIDPSTSIGGTEDPDWQFMGQPLVDTSKVQRKFSWQDVRSKFIEASPWYETLYETFTGVAIFVKEPGGMILQVEPTHIISRPEVTRDKLAGADRKLALVKPLHVLVPDPAAVRIYLAMHSAVADLVPFVCKLTRERMGSDVELSLEVYSDPEINYEYLTLCVRLQQYDRHILDVLRAIRAQYSNELIGKRGRLLVTTDFDNPRKGHGV